jgi:hypothetical protein
MEETLVVVDDNRVIELTLEGDLVEVFGRYYHREEIHTSDVTVLRTGDVAVAEAFENSILVLDGETGNLLRNFGRRGDLDGEFRQPVAITSDANDNLLVLDRFSNRLQVFNAEGRHLCTRSDLGLSESGPKALAWEVLQWRSRTAVLIAAPTSRQGKREQHAGGSRQQAAAAATANWIPNRRPRTHPGPTPGPTPGPAGKAGYRSQ